MSVKTDQKIPDWVILLPAALFVLVAHLMAIKGYGYFRDELYYIACSEHPAFGYVDQPPLSLWILKAVRTILGDSLFAIRILPVLFSAVWVVLTGLIARMFGGRKYAMLLASFAAAAPLGNLFLFSYYSMNFLDLIFWQILFIIIIKLVQTDQPRYWIVFGIVAGLGLLNKISILFLSAGLVTGLLLTDNRYHLKTRQFWTGVVIAFALFLPYVLWNALHDWAFLEFMHNAKTYKMADVTPVQFFIGQFLYNNPINIWVWIPGLIFLLMHRSAKIFRVFGWMYVFIYILFTIQQAKDYYLAAAYPVLFAGGAVLWEKWMGHRLGLVFKPVLVLLIVLSTALMSPMTLAILPVEKTINFMKSTGIRGNPGENHEVGILPQYYADMHGWKEMVDTFAAVYSQLSPEEQSDCLIYVRNYGEAGAIDFFGRAYGLPKAVCAHNNYWIWGPPEWNGETAIVYGWSHNVEDNLNDLNRRFDSVDHEATFHHPYCMPYQNNRPIFICRNARFDFREIWNQEKNFN